MQKKKEIRLCICELINLLKPSTGLASDSEGSRWLQGPAHPSGFLTVALFQPGEDMMIFSIPVPPGARPPPGPHHNLLLLITDVSIPLPRLHGNFSDSCIQTSPPVHLLLSWQEPFVSFMSLFTAGDLSTRSPFPLLVGVRADVYQFLSFTISV